MIKTYHYIRQSLENFYPETEIRSFALQIFRNVAGISLVDVFSNSNYQLTENQLSDIQNIVSRLQKYEPLQYILGETNFYGFDFYVDSSVLIPRPETEELVDWILQSLSPTLPYRILDIGTGSGCIAICLAKYLPKADVVAWDISEKALQTAEKNAKRNEVKITFEKIDVLKFDSNNITEKFDVIVSNPPYVTEQEKEKMEKNVLDYEPSTALFVSDDTPILFYEKIGNLALNLLSNNGFLFFETSSIFGKGTADLLLKIGFRDVELKKDISGKDRMIKAKL